MRRFLIVAAAFVFLLVGVGWWWVTSGSLKERVEQRLTEALGREVTIGELEVDAIQGAARVVRLQVANPEGFDGAPILASPTGELHVDLEELLDGRIKGTVTAAGLTLRVVKLGGLTSVHGMFPRKGKGDGAVAIDLDLEIKLSQARVLLEDLDRGEALELVGVELDVAVTNAPDAREAVVHASIDAVNLHGVTLHDVEIDATASPEALVVTALTGRLGEGGKITGQGQAQLKGETAWNFALSATDVALDDDVLPLVVALYPPLAGHRQAVGEVEGTAHAQVELHGKGLRWAGIAPSLRGNGSLELRDIVVPTEALALRVAAFAGGVKGPWRVRQTTVRFDVADQWVELSGVELDDARKRIPVEGRVSFKGDLDLKVDVLPLVSLIDPRVETSVGRYATSLPVRVGGTVRDPDLQAPTANDVGKSVAGALLRRAVSGHHTGSTDAPSSK